MVAQRPERKAKHPNLREDSFKIIPVQITQEPPVSFVCHWFLFLPMGRLYYLNHRWTSLQDGGGSTIYNSVPKYFQKRLKKKQLSKPSAFQKGQFGALFDMNHYGWENKISFVIQLEFLLCLQCLTILNKCLWNYHPKDNFVKIVTLKKAQVLKKHLVLINCNYCNFTMYIYKFSLQSQ